MLPFVRKHALTVVADLRREYGIDLLDFWRGRLSFFELCAYLIGLPADTRTSRIMFDNPESVEGWGIVPQLLGILIDSVRGQWSEKPVDSVLPKGLFDNRSVEPASSKSEIQPDRAAMMLLGSPADQIARYSGR